MNRRRFVLLGSTGIAVLSIPFAYSCSGDVAYDPILAQPKSLSSLWDAGTLTAIGNKYRAQVQDENNVRSLVNHLMEGLPDSKAVLAKSLDEKIITDFKTGQTVLVDGWVLSVTEARQCALFSQTQAK